jgi:predicted nucleic acid-binding protein
VILLDTTVLNNFAHIERPELLRLVMADAATTSHVMTELGRGVASGHVPACDWQWLEVIELTPAEQDRLACIRLVLDDGEASCIAVALERNASLFTDDLPARHDAQRRGITVSGTLGVLVALITKGHLTLAEADEFLHEMIAHGYRSSVRSLANLNQATGP